MYLYCLVLALAVSAFSFAPATALQAGSIKRLTATNFTCVLNSSTQGGIGALIPITDDLFLLSGGYPAATTLYVLDASSCKVLSRLTLTYACFSQFFPLANGNVFHYCAGATYELQTSAVMELAVDNTSLAISIVRETVIGDRFQTLGTAKMDSTAENIWLVYSPFSTNSSFLVSINMTSQELSQHGTLEYTSFQGEPLFLSPDSQTIVFAAYKGHALVALNVSSGAVVSTFLPKSYYFDGFATPNNGYFVLGIDTQFRTKLAPFVWTAPYALKPVTVDEIGPFSYGWDVFVNRNVAFVVGYSASQASYALIEQFDLSVSPPSVISSTPAALNGAITASGKYFAIGLTSSIVGGAFGVAFYPLE